MTLYEENQNMVAEMQQISSQINVEKYEDKLEKIILGEEVEFDRFELEKQFGRVQENICSFFKKIYLFDEEIISDHPNISNRLLEMQSANIPLNTESVYIPINPFGYLTSIFRREVFDHHKGSFTAYGAFANQFYGYLNMTMLHDDEKEIAKNLYVLLELKKQKVLMEDLSNLVKMICIKLMKDNNTTL